MADEKPSRRPTKEFKVQPAGDETVRPPFDPEEYARESESRLRIADVVPPPARTPVPFDAPPGSESGTRLTAATGAPSPEDVPYRVMAQEDLEWFDLDRDAVALLERVNGLRAIRRIAATIGVEEALACAIFMRLAAEGIVGFR